MSSSGVHVCVLFIPDLLERWAPDGDKLELFARNLLPGWTSWGNQVCVCVCEGVSLPMLAYHYDYNVHLQVLKFQQVQRGRTIKTDSTLN